MNTSKLTVVAASLLALAATVQAQTAMANNVTVSGYAAGSYTKTTGVLADRLDLDSGMLKITGDYKPVTVVLSLFDSQAGSVQLPATVSDFDILDAYATYDVGSGWAVTGGRFLSWMGYESFFAPINNPEISFANTTVFPIAGYEDGVRVTYTEKDWNAGLAFVDSVLSTVTPFKGDGELKNDYGIEAYFSYGGIADNTLWVGFSFDSHNGLTGTASAYTIDVWDQYQISKELSVAAEVTFLNAAINANTWLVLANYAFDDHVSLAVRASGDEISKGGALADDLKFTIAPAYKFNDHFTVKAELSMTNFSGTTKPDATFYGVQAVFKF